VHCLKYDSLFTTSCESALHHRCELLELGSGALDSPGLDLLQSPSARRSALVVTEVTVKLVPRPQLAQLVMASFDDVARPVMP